MPTIQEHADLVTLMVVFTVTPEQQDPLVEQLRTVLAFHSQLDGFVSCSIHKSLDGVRVSEYIQWRSRAHFDAMMALPESIAHVGNANLIADAHMYDVVAVADGVPAGVS